MLVSLTMPAHSMTPDQYRKDYGLPSDYPLVAPEYSERRSGMAKARGFRRKKSPETAAAAPAEAPKAVRSRRKKAPADGE